MEVWGVSFRTLVLNLLLLVVVLVVTHLFVALKRNQRRLRAVGPDVVLVSQVFSYFSLATNLLPVQWFGWALPYRWTDLHLPLDAVFRRTRANVVAFVAATHVELFVNDAKLVKDVMIKQHQHFPKPLEDYESVRVWGENIVTAPSEGYEWKKHRSLCTPAFSSGNLVLVTTTTVDSVNRLFEKWEQQTTTDKQGEVVHDVLVDEDMTTLMLAIIAKAGFGQTLPIAAGKTEHYDASKHSMSFSQSMNIVSSNLLLWAAMPWAFKIPFGRPKRIGQGFVDFKKYITTVISEKRQQQQLARQNKQQADGEPGQEGTETRTGESRETDLLALLCSAQDSDSKITLTDDEIFSDAFIFLLAGHETTAHTMMWALALLAQHPEEQTKLYEEAIAVLGDREPTYDDYERLTYAQCVFKETLRLYPPVVGLAKMASQDITLPGGYHVPKGTRVSMAIYSIHRNPEYWEEPDAFRPSRFDARVSPPVSPYHFLPFSLGRRSCIGSRFAQVEGVTALAKIMRKFTIHLPPGTDVAKLMQGRNILTLGPVNPMHLWFRPRA